MLDRAGVAALLNAVVLIAISTLIGREAVGRLSHPTPVDAPVMLQAAAVILPKGETV